MPWQRLIREWVIYAGIMTAIFLLLSRGGSAVGAIAGVLISGPLYLLLGFVLAKFGYQRKTMKQLRTDRGNRAASAAAGERDGSEGTTSRARPAPTRRTSQGTNRPSKRKKR